MAKQFIVAAFVAAFSFLSAMAELTYDVTPENEEAWRIVLPGDASAYPIQWSISGDEQDFAGGVTVSFSGCNNAKSIRVTDSQSGTFVPDFGAVLGTASVTLTIESGSGFLWMRTYSYEISLPEESNETGVGRMMENYSGTVTAEMLAATGGDILLVYNSTASTAELTLDGQAKAWVLAIGGGGAGANPGEARSTQGGAGGGGAGGFVEETDLTLESGTYAITVGAGGVSPEEQGAGGNGSPSFVSFGGNTIIEAFGGGGGGIMADVGRDGGSGGGGSRSGSPGSGASGQGNDGGTATIIRSGGGGGGAGGVGASPVSSSIGGAGGDGRESVITGESLIYAAGGGGGSRIGTGGAGGDGVGGNGGGTEPATNGIGGTGSGGGGGSYSSQVGGNGGSGVVIVRITSIVGPKVDFDSNWESSEFWRSVHENSTLTGGMTPRLVANAELETAMTMYVWSEDESAVYVNTDNIVDMRVSATGDTELRHVGIVFFAGGQTYANFSIVGASGGAGKTANLVLSAYPNFNYSTSTGDRIHDYCTVPVYCIEPLPTVLSVECDTATLVADADYLTAKSRLSVRLSQPCDEDVTVTLTPSFEDGYSGNWADYIRFSTVESELSWLPEAKSPTVVIPAGSTESGTIYVFALRSDTHTIGIGHQLRITPSATGVDSCISCGFSISANAPRIVSPTATSEYCTTAGEELEVYVAVEDTYADMIDKTTGYQVRVKTSDANGWHTLDERFKASEEGGGLVGITTGNLPAITYSSAGDFVSQIYVVSPISGKQSDPVSFTVHAFAPPPTATATTMDDNGNVYNEGDMATFQVALSEGNDTGSSVYAFLKAGNGAKAAMFGGRTMFVVCDDTDPAKTKGLRIDMNQSTAQGMINLLDNPAAANGQVSFSVVLCSTEQYDSANVLGGFQSNNLTIKVNNVEPSINRIELNGFESDCDGYVFPRRAIVGASQTFQAVVQDAANDLSADFETKWTVYCDGIERWSETNVGNPHVHANAYSCSFPRSGAWTVRCQVKDKDMDDWSEQSYSVGVNVIQPGVTLTTDDSYLETDSRKSLEVGLNYYDYNADEIVVKLTVTPPDRTNPGELVLDSTYKTVPTGYPVLGDNEYYVSLRKYDSLASVGIVSMDGTAASSMYGFRIKAEVVTPEWSDVYVPATKCVYVHNVAPTVDSVTPESPNAMMAPGGVASTPISWQVRSDVDADLAAGITVRFEGCGNAFTTNVTEATGGSFVPDFGSRSGSQSVTMTIEDKDGGGQTWTYLYEVIPPSPQVAVEVNGAAVEFETAADGKTRTATVAVGTTAEDVKVFVGGVDVTAGFKVSVEGTTAMVVLKEPYETARSASAPYQENEDGTTVTLNVEVVPGLYYAADSAATIEALKRPGAAEPAKAGDAVVAPKQEGAQGFYKVWVSDAPIEAE